MTYGPQHARSAERRNHKASSVCCSRCDLWHLLPALAVQLLAGLGSRAARLLEEERYAGGLALSPERACPVRVHYPSLGPALAPHDDPMYIQRHANSAAV